MCLPSPPSTHFSSSVRRPVCLPQQAHSCPPQGLHMLCPQREWLVPLAPPPPLLLTLQNLAQMSLLPNQVPLVQSHNPLLFSHFLIATLFESLVSCLLYQSVSFKRIRTSLYWVISRFFFQSAGPCSSMVRACSYCTCMDAEGNVAQQRGHMIWVLMLDRSICGFIESVSLPSLQALVISVCIGNGCPMRACGRWWSAGVSSAALTSEGPSGPFSVEVKDFPIEAPAFGVLGLEAGVGRIFFSPVNCHWQGSSGWMGCSAAGRVSRCSYTREGSPNSARADTPDRPHPARLHGHCAEGSLNPGFPASQSAPCGGRPS